MHGTIDQFSFRQLHHRYLLLVNDNENLNVLKLTSFPHEKKDNSILLYGYIDSTAGLSFEMLSFAYFSWDGSVQYRAVLAPGEKGHFGPGEKGQLSVG